jgi:hypothetical protein
MAEVAGVRWKGENGVVRLRDNPGRRDIDK